MKMKNKFFILAAGFIIMLLLLSSKVFAADTNSVGVKVGGTLDYTKAQEVLTIVNKHRKNNGLSPLTMDKELLDVAMQRAVETGIYFSHDRPNGTSCFSASKKMSGENIAAGSSTAEGTMNQWMNSSGHKANILDSSYKSIGIGCFKNGSAYYWVQCFGRNAATEVSAQKGTTNVTKTISILKNKAKLYAYTVKNASNANYMKVTETGYTMYGIANAGWGMVYSVGIVSDYGFSSSNTKVITIDSNGKFKAVGEGKATVKVYLKQDPTNCFTEEITVKRDDINKDYLYVKNLNSSYQYNGSAVKPKPTIYYTMSTKLVEGKDYTLSYSNNNSVGTATITITGIGKYKGTVKKTFKITPLSISKCSISKVSNQTYTGKAIKPGVTVKYGKTTLKNGTDYTVSYKNNINVGTATVTIKGKGKYTGSVSKTFKISIRTVKGLAAISETQGSIKLKWTRDSAVTGYEIYMATSKNGRYSKIATIGKNSTITYNKIKLSSGRTYYFKIREYKTINKKKYYGSYSSILTAGTRAKKPSIKITAGSKKATIRWNKVSGATGYDVFMSTSQNGKYTNVATITKGTTVSYTKKNLKKGNRYYFKVRTYRTVAGKKIYGSFSSIRNVKVK